MSKWVSWHVCNTRRHYGCTRSIWRSRSLFLAEAGVIYKIPWNGCPRVYACQTDGTLALWLKNHKQALLNLWHSRQRQSIVQPPSRLWPPRPPVSPPRLVKPHSPPDWCYYTFYCIAFLLYNYSLLTVLFILFHCIIILYSLHHPWPTVPPTL